LAASLQHYIIIFLIFQCVSEQTLKADASSRPRKEGAADPLQPQGADGDPWTCRVGSGVVTTWVSTKIMDLRKQDTETLQEEVAREKRGAPTAEASQPAKQLNP